jgi:hypothetical protein
VGARRGLLGGRPGEPGVQQADEGKGGPRLASDARGGGLTVRVKGGHDPSGFATAAFGHNGSTGAAAGGSENTHVAEPIPPDGSEIRRSVCAVGPLELEL